jgi:uncharacterized membrane protein YhaH (DUF805 family)
MPKFHCIHCGQRIDAPETMAGVQSACPTCNGAIQVPGFPPRSQITNSVGYQSSGSSPRRNAPTRRSNGGFFRRITTFRGRLGRLQYFYGWLFKMGLIMVVGCLLIALQAATSEDTAMIIGLPLCLAVIWINLSLQARRLHDIGQPAWWLLLYFVPFVNFIFAFILYIVCFFEPGTRKGNKYGDSPEPIFG